ncbi:hypothetical protein MCOR25_002525 [Pyricularia grisea]|uniref:Uncharacterized protein n=1 Tax=Pyricularia grisea TaxID=148305 RepID=A0A6P8B2Q4_PYRGI|nr:uncharacterized protein PgNI_06839 [Pyricularia grisea]KAI6377543.1 hypothetical protein MCOR25_002525 [Pyricularia grisea]TLD09079.1 hypothetical protein PgNI_06839 [Pyricularia grisea]
MVSMVVLLDAPSPDESEDDLIDHAKKLAAEFANRAKSAFDWLLQAADDKLVDNVWFSPSRNWDPRNTGSRMAQPQRVRHASWRHWPSNDKPEVKASTITLMMPGGRSQQELIDEYEVGMKVKGGRKVELSEGSDLILHNWEMVMSRPLLNKGLDQVASGRPICPLP